IIHRDIFFKVTGKLHSSAEAVEILKDLYVSTQPVRGDIGEIEPDNVHLAITQSKALEQDVPQLAYGKEMNIK
ncbi:PhoH family protein, partial [Pseudoalteromonas aliena]